MVPGQHTGAQAVESFEVVLGNGDVVAISETDAQAAIDCAVFLFGSTVVSVKRLTDDTESVHVDA